MNTVFTKPPSAAKRRWRCQAIQLVRWIVILVCFALICTNAGLVFFLRTQTLAQAQQANTNLARAVAERVGSAIADAEHILQGIAFEIERSGFTAELFAHLQPFLTAQANVAGQIDTIVVYGSNGQLLASSRSGNLVNEDGGGGYLRRHADTGGNFVLGDPRRSALSGVWVFPLSLRVNDAQGNLAGVVVATLSIEHFREVLARFELGHEGAITLTLERRVLVRRPYRESLVGVLGSASIINKMFGDLSAGTDEEASPVDGVIRLYSYDSIANYPLRVTVAAGKAEVLRNWQGAAIVQTLWISFLCVILWLSASWAQRLMQRQRTARIALRKARDELERANVELSHLAQYDALTGLPNRRFFDSQLFQVYRHAQRHQRSMAIVMVDVDEFKKYNDFYGHLSGDACLRRVAQALHPVAARPQDFIARYGGEEIVILLPETGLEGARQVAEAACQAVAALSIPHAGSKLKTVTISVGVASWVPEGTESPSDMLKYADAALYEAKRTGRNRVSSEATDFGALAE